MLAGSGFSPARDIGSLPVGDAAVAFRNPPTSSGESSSLSTPAGCRHFCSRKGLAAGEGQLPVFGAALTARVKWARGIVAAACMRHRLNGYGCHESSVSSERRRCHPAAGGEFSAVSSSFHFTTFADCVGRRRREFGRQDAPLTGAASRKKISGRHEATRAAAAKPADADIPKHYQGQAPATARCWRSVAAPLGAALRIIRDDDDSS